MLIIVYTAFLSKITDQTCA